MTDELNNVERLEKDAEKLIATLDKLATEVSSYNTAKDELKKTNEGLLNFLSQTKDSVKESQKIVREINKILNSQITEKIEGINLTVSHEIQKMEKKLLGKIDILQRNENIIKILSGISIIAGFSSIIYLFVFK
jgi:ElaB/YqjD/DUF883 family membrane-anchored ribosome-binding protein